MIDFCVSIGSTYSYLTVIWRPFSVRTIMIEQQNIPFVGKPVKLAYMWRDISRRAKTYGLAPRLPAPYPLKDFDLANKIAVLAETEGWSADHILAAYRRGFEFGEKPGSEPGLSSVLKELGRDPARVVAAAQTGRIEERGQGQSEKRGRVRDDQAERSAHPRAFSASRTRARPRRLASTFGPSIGAIGGRSPSSPRAPSTST